MKKSEEIIKAISEMKIWEKIIYVWVDAEYVIEKRRTSHNNKSYKWLNPNIVIIDDFIWDNHK